VAQSTRACFILMCIFFALPQYSMAQWAPGDPGVMAANAFSSSSGGGNYKIIESLRQKFLATTDENVRKSIIVELEHCLFASPFEHKSEHLDFVLTIINEEIRRKSWFHAMRMILDSLSIVRYESSDEDWSGVRKRLELALNEVLNNSWSPEELRNFASEYFYPSNFLQNNKGKLLISALAWHKKFQGTNLDDFIEENYHSFDQLQQGVRLKTLCRRGLSYAQWLQQANEFPLDSYVSNHRYRISRLDDLSHSLSDQDLAKSLCVHYRYCLSPGGYGDDEEFAKAIKVLNARHKFSILKSVCEMDEAQYSIQLADSKKLTLKDAKLLKAAKLLDSSILGLRRRHDRFSLFCLANAEYLQGLLSERQGHLVASSQLMLASLAHFNAAGMGNHVRARSCLWWLALNTLRTSDRANQNKYFRELTDCSGALRCPVSVGTDIYRAYPTPLDLWSLCEVFYSRTRNAQRIKFCTNKINSILSGHGSEDYMSSKIQFTSSEEMLATTPDYYTGVPDEVERVSLIEEIRRRKL
jgi:hypothetical protein